MATVELTVEKYLIDTCNFKNTLNSSGQRSSERNILWNLDSMLKKQNQLL